MMAEREEELNHLLINVKEENEKVGLKLNIQKTKIMASGPITSRQICEVTMETVIVYFIIFFRFYLFIYFSFIFISWRLITLQYCSGFCHTLTIVCDCSPERCLLLGRKAMTNIDSILKSRNITLLTNSL